MKQALIATVLFCAFYALQIVFQQLFVRTAIHPIHLNFLSCTSASIIMTVYFLIFNKKQLILKPDKKIVPLFILALAGWLLADFFSVTGLRYSSSINYSILSRTMIFVTFLLSVIFLKEKATLYKVLGAIISGLGGIFVIYNFKTKININPGDILFLITVLSQSVSGISRQKMTGKITPMQLTYLLFTYGAVILGAITFIFLPLRDLSQWRYVIFNTIVGMVGFNLVNYAIQKGGVVFFSLVANLLPLFTVIFSFFILRQLPVITQLAGGILIVTGIVIFQKKHENR